MRPTFLALLAGLLGLALVPYPGSPASASCAAPRLSVEGHAQDQQRVTLRPGEEVTVTGRGFVDGCDDGGEGPTGLGCSGDDGGEAEVPLEDVELVAVQGRPTPEQMTLGVADAGSAEDDELGWITWTFTVPESLSPGPAVLKTEGSEPLPVRIVPLVVVD